MWRRVAWLTFLFSAVSATGLVVIGWLYLQRLRTDLSVRFRNHTWRIASKVYADSYLVYPGIDVVAAGLRDRLFELGYEEHDEPPDRPGFFCISPADTWLIYQRAFPPWRPNGALIRLELSGSRLQRIVHATTGEELPTLELEPALLSGLYAEEWEERRIVSVEEVPPLLVQAILDTEDRRFFEHRGIDVYGILRALWANLRAQRVVEGGSTLTQQLMKNFFLDDERTLRRKLQEAMMAFLIEREFSKEEILENYLNEIYLGQRGAQAIHGVWEASQFYFGKTPRELTVAEIAMIAGLIRGPNLYSPHRDPDRALRRRNHVLGRMLRAGHIDEQTYQKAVAEPLRTAPYVLRTRDAPYFSDFVRRQLAELYPPDILFNEGLRVFTTLDLHLQRLAEEAVAQGLTRLEYAHRRLRAAAEEGDALQACLLAIQPQTGFIRAMVGGRDYRSSQFNRCTQALRQPGSVFKPIIYAAALRVTRQDPEPLLPTTQIDDTPFTWTYDGRTWTPSNYERRYLGVVTMRTALEQSLNAATARLAFQVGLPEIITTARDLGISSPLPPYPAVVLGAAEVSPFEIAQAYSVFANGGVRTRPLALRRVSDRSGVPLERSMIEVESVLPPDTAFLVTHMLTGVLDRGTAASARRLGFRGIAAGKTGTTNDYQDAWFVGYTPELLTVVWVGFDSQRPVGLSGARAALPIWVEFMKQATAGLPASDFIPPPNVRLVRIDPESGALATEDCPEVVVEAFYADHVPLHPCPLHGNNATAPPAQEE
ncbi:MAG: PBP1A family penicillin-binding protein [Candidatus Binatia bacterium]|nr:PBP1A family penicillin-binding protein [Candidatus Binatia bacterium]